MLRRALDTRKTLGNIVSTGNAARMERTHRELGARFPDGLGGNGPDSFADFDLAGRGEVASIALAADAKVGFAGKNAADLDFSRRLAMTSAISSVM